LKVPTTTRAQQFTEFVIEESGAPQKTEPIQPEPASPIQPLANDSIRGQPQFPYENEVKRAIIKVCKKRPKPTKKIMPYLPDIISAFAPGQEIHITEDTSPDKYKEITGWKPSTIEKLVRKYYK